MTDTDLLLPNLSRRSALEALYDAAVTAGDLDRAAKVAQAIEETYAPEKKLYERAVRSLARMRRNDGG